MATLRESNERMIQTLGDEKHFKHGTESPWIRNLINRFDLWKLPMCFKCERFAIWDKDGTATCPKCGSHYENPITVEQFYEQGLQVDRTVKPGAPQYVERKKVKFGHVAEVYAGEAGLDGDPNRKIIIARS